MKKAKTICDREYEKFDECKEVLVRTDEIKLIRTDLQGAPNIEIAQIFFQGRACSQDALTSEAVWQIQRVSRQGDEIVKEFADDGNYTQVWDDRQTLFSVLPFANIFSVLFDGVDEYVNIGNITALDFDFDDPFSYSLWSKSTDSGGKFIEKKDGNGTKWETTGMGDFKFTLKDSTNDEIKVKATVKPTELEDGEWHHYVVTYDGSNLGSGITMYIDGSSIALTIEKDEGLIDLSNSGSFNIGADSNGNGNVEGNLDEVSVWDKELSAAEITEIYNSGIPDDLDEHSAETNLVSWWRMGDGDSFPTLNDVKGGHDGVMVNMENSDITSDTPP